MKYFIWNGIHHEDDNSNKVQISKKAAIEKFGAEFVNSATNNFEMQRSRHKAIVGITYNTLGSCWDEDYMYDLTIEK